MKWDDLSDVTASTNTLDFSAGYIEMRYHGPKIKYMAIALTKRTI